MKSVYLIGPRFNHSFNSDFGLASFKLADEWKLWRWIWRITKLRQCEMGVYSFTFTQEIFRRNLWKPNFENRNKTQKTETTNLLISTSRKCHQHQQHEAPLRTVPICRPLHCYSQRVSNPVCVWLCGGNSHSHLWCRLRINRTCKSNGLTDTDLFNIFILINWTPGTAETLKRSPTRFSSTW